MNTAKERAEEWLNENIEALKKENGLYWHDRVVSIELLLKEQDKITREACAYEVTRCVIICETPNGNSAISPDEAHDRCMNVKAV